VKIENTVFSLPLNRQESWLKAIAGAFAERLEQNRYPLRFSIVDLTAEQVLIESTILTFDSQHRYAKTLSSIEILAPRRKAFQARPFGVCSDHTDRNPLRVRRFCRRCDSRD
jgi:hypothetical protein